MSTEVETIVKELGLENARIQVGRERIYPPRDGLVVSPKAIEQLKAALSSPDAVKSTIKITEGETTKFWVSKGVVNVPLNPQIEEQAQKVMPAINAPEPEKLQAHAEKITAAAQETYFDLLKEHPDFKDLVGVVTRDELLEQPASIQQISDRQVSEMAIKRGLSEHELEQLIDRGSPYVQQQREAGALSTVQRYQTDLWFENRYQFEHQTSLPQRDAYIGLSDGFYNDSMYPGDEYSDLYAKAQADPDHGKANDAQVVQSALKRKVSPDGLKAVLSESPYVQSQIDKGVPLSDLQDKYIAPIMAQYKQFYGERITQGSPEENLRNALEKVTAPPVQVSSNPEVPAVAPETAEVSSVKTFDFPTDAVNHAAPVQGFAATVQTQLESAQATAIAAKENLELAQKNLATFAQKVKHRGFKAWAKDQMPILKEKAQEIAAQQTTKLKDWAKEQAPVVKGAAIKTAKQVGHEVAVTTEIVGAVAFALGSVVVEAAVEKSKELGSKAWEKLEKATQLVDPATLDPALKTLVALHGKDGYYSGGEVNYQQTEKGVNVYAKDGTPVYVDGKVNPEANRCFVDRLNRVAGNLKQFHAAILSPSTVQQQQTPGHHQPAREKAKGFGR
jgi:hypothetical protein